jgi:predicted transcriptional regulator
MTDTLEGLCKPVRREILALICEQGDGGISPREIAGELDKPLPNIGYHIRMLAEKGLISLQRTEQVRGATAHYYVCPAEVGNDPLVRLVLELPDSGTDKGDGPA